MVLALESSNKQSPERQQEHYKNRNFSEKTDTRNYRGKKGMFCLGAKIDKTVDCITCMIENILNEFEN